MKIMLRFTALWLLLHLTLFGRNAFAQPPVITAYSPTSGSVGTLITVTGTNLGSPTAFRVGGTAAIVISRTGSKLVGLVMPGAVTGPVSVTTAGGTATGGGSFTVTPTRYPSAQQGGKLTGTGNTGIANYGYSVALSADGNTAIVSGHHDNIFEGAIWIFTRNGTRWNQQAKLKGTGNTGAAYQGYSVALSADGNTAISGGFYDNGNQGAAWVFTRNGATWSQQAKLIGTGNTGAACQGYSVALSADGNTAMCGGNNDSGSYGAAWIFTRSGVNWSQQAKLTGTGNTGAAQQGNSVALSADGNTAMSGGYRDNSDQGAAWIFTRSGATWSQQAKLTGTGSIGAAQQGHSVALSADGNTAMSGGIADNAGQGGAWIFTRIGTTWSQQAKLTATGNIGAASQGMSVTLSADGSTAISGGHSDNSNQGAAWVFTRNGTTWSQQAKLTGTGNIGAASQGYSVTISADGNTALSGGHIDSSYLGAAWVFVAPPVTTGISPFALPNGSVAVSPMPAANALSISNAAVLNGQPASIIDMTGREVWRFTMRGIQQIDVRGWATGIYTLRLACGVMLRIVKQ